MKKVIVWRKFLIFRKGVLVMKKIFSRIVFTLLLFLLSASCCWAFYWDEPYDDYKQNPIQAENKWVNMRLQFFNGVNAIISSIGKNLVGQPYISIIDGNNKNAKVDYTFYFDDEGPYPKQLLEARKGQSVKISGVVNKLRFTKGFFGNDSLLVVLSDPQFLD